jgi:hypothetical protein
VPLPRSKTFASSRPEFLVAGMVQVNYKELLYKIIKTMKNNTKAVSQIIVIQK